jgi:two-component system KDP operon response regulator KdpE
MSAPEKPTKILVVDDEEQIRRALKSILLTRKYNVYFAVNGEKALDVAIECSPDLIILDMSMPKMNGVETCKQLRNWFTGPILILSVKGNETDKINALDAGADDYLTKPFSAGELLARIRALLRRSSGNLESEPAINIGNIEINLAKRTVQKAGQEIDLTRLEFDILAYLAKNADCVVTSKMILTNVWGPEYGNDNLTLRVHISHLRKKIEPLPSVPSYILTEPGVGFRLATMEIKSQS